MYYTYMIRCEDNSIYTGITTDLMRRFEEHSQKIANKCAKYTLTHQVVKIEAAWQSETRAAASKLEYRIKKLSKTQKEAIIHDDVAFCEIIGQLLDIKEYKKLDNNFLHI